MQRIGLALALAFMFNSCDVVEQPIIEYGVYRSDLYGAAPTFIPVDTPVQKVLLEDFTGHDCGNCPNGHMRAAELLAQYGDSIAVVAVHAGSLAQPVQPDYPNDWTTPEGTYYLLTQVGQDIMPKGRINRRPGASTIFNPSTWAAQAAEAIAEQPPVNMQVKADYHADKKHWNVHVFSEWLQNTSGNYKLVVMVTESGIVAPQLFYGNNPEYIPDYHHEHMLRTTGTGATGLTVFTNPTAGTIKVESYTFDWNDAWIPENCEVIAFLTDGDNGRVMNVAKTKLIQ
jgi:Outer membrane protein Omp28